ncbi:MAG: hypothetical protein BGO31_19270 [Bacteroidetes bacterium 43-16]|nr:MAG: hypothetical protein BGO31_19270 [Bacteroidetes bacterium 43-16]
MKVAAHVWFTAAIAECLLYSLFVELPAGIVVLPFALVGGLPGMFMFWCLIEAIHSLWEKGVAKWVAIICAAFATANGTLVLFLLVMGLPFDSMPFFTMLNAATAIALALNWKKINKLYFAAPPELVDVEQNNSIYEFKQVTDEN